MRKPYGRFWKNMLTLLLVTGLLTLLLGWQSWNIVRQSRLDYGLIVAVRDGDSARVTRLLAEGADPNARDLEAQKYTTRQILKIFMDRLLRRPVAVPRKATALILAAEHPHPDITRALLQAGARPDYTDGESRTAIIAAAYCGEADNIKELIEGKANIDAVDDNGRSALMGASVSGFEPAVSVLLEHGANPNVQTVFGRTSLMWAAGFHFPVVVRLLLNHKADVNTRDKEGKSALMYALGDGAANISLSPAPMIKVTYDTLKAHGGIYPRGEAGQEIRGCVTLLLLNGADANTRDNTGLSAAKLVALKGYPDLIDALAKAGAKP